MLNYAAEVNLPRGARALTIDVNPSLATKLRPDESLPDAAMWPGVPRREVDPDVRRKESRQYHQNGSLIGASNSTNIRVGCTSASRVTVFDIDGPFTTANLMLAVQAHAPPRSLSTCE